MWQRVGSVLSRGVDPSSTFYVLNPHSNLLGTEQRFRGWFERWGIPGGVGGNPRGGGWAPSPAHSHRFSPSEPGWRGVTGTVPSPQQMQAALLEHDLYM